MDPDFAKVNLREGKRGRKEEGRRIEGGKRKKEGRRRRRRREEGGGRICVTWLTALFKGIKTD
jgi:hypothetical protein